MIGFEENEISKNANGGTELVKRRLAGLIDQDLLSNFQIISSRIRDLDESKIRILWSHDLPEDPESEKMRDKKFRDKFHKMVFVSDWQYQRYQLVCGMPYDTKSVVFEHGIVPFDASVLEKPTDIIRIVYISTPQRGLELVVPVFKHLAEKFPNIHLDVFSSFNIYGWKDADAPYKPLFDEIAEHPQMTYHGTVSNEELRVHLAESHILAYPSIWLETACLSLMECMSAGLLCVHPNYGALPETSAGLTIMYHGNFEDKNEHANVFVNYLEAAINLIVEKKQGDMLGYNKFYVDNKFNINRVKNKWEALLNDLLSKYPTPESRAFPKEMFTYRTTS
jgi:glycosyltransferase involved in cell wall biosynthesis